jgi:hypothetical protein
MSSRWFSFWFWCGLAQEFSATDRQQTPVRKFFSRKDIFSGFFPARTIRIGHTWHARF